MDCAFGAEETSTVSGAAVRDFRDPPFFGWDHHLGQAI
jgi:hypothetical protein